MTEILMNPVYEALDADRKNMVDSFIDFLYVQQSNASDEAGETANVIQAALRGKDLIGPFDTVEDMVRSLDA